MRDDEVRPTTTKMMAALALLVVCAVVAVSACSSTPAPSAGAPATSSPADIASCSPTLPNADTPPGEKTARLFYGNGKLWTVLWPRGVVVFTPRGPGEVRADGSLAVKFPFWRGPGVIGDLVISGGSLDDPGARMSGEVPEGYGKAGFQASVLVFPRPGCWQVTARVGAANLTFVTRVVRRP